MTFFLQTVSTNHFYLLTLGFYSSSFALLVIPEQIFAVLSTKRE